jgi:hypothetical protein
MERSCEPMCKCLLKHELCALRLAVSGLLKIKPHILRISTILF